MRIYTITGSSRLKYQFCLVIRWCMIVVEWIVVWLSSWRQDRGILLIAEILCSGQSNTWKPHSGHMLLMFCTMFNRYIFGVADDDDHMCWLSCLSNNASWTWGWWGVHRLQCRELGSSMWRIGKYTSKDNFLCSMNEFGKSWTVYSYFSIWHIISPTALLRS